MPLLEMSPNIQESDTMNRKRSHDEFTGDAIKMEETGDMKPSAKTTIQSLENCNSSTLSQPDDKATISESPSRTQVRSSTPTTKSSHPEAASGSPDTKPSPALPNSSTPSKASSNPPAKRKRLTGAEKEARTKELEEAKSAKAAEKARIEEEKAARAKERAAEKAKAEEEKAAKAKERAAEKAKADEEKAMKAKEREEKKRKKEEEQKRIQEEKEKKARSQPTLANFFGGMPKTQKTADTPSVKDEPSKGLDPAKAAPKETKTQYEKMFKPFFVKENTRMASIGPEMDEETRGVKSRILDECISGKRADEVKEFDAMSLFALPNKPLKRGKLHHPVKHIMEQVYKEIERSDASDPDQALKFMAQAREKLKKIPMKIIAFSQDVRPPYYGTATFKPFALGKENMSQLARQPTKRRLPLDYEYDSEAEWQEEEEGEDLDMEDDEEELDDEDDMEEFLDDSEDAGLSRRVFANTMEPENSGICFESTESSTKNQNLHEYRMEFMHEGLEQTWGIDPFSTQYWEPELKTKTVKSVKTAKADSEPATKMAPPPTPINAFAALTGGPATTDAPKMVKAEILDDVKQAILDNAALSKVGIIDFIFHQFRDSVSRMEVKNTLEYVAEKKGTGRQKSWALKPGHEIVS
ncbi:chromatin assembly factor 1 subunit A-domain-containing protein [Mariannaea sp. PMI_226]|nr:chromatin assembly factor 1 subunit A-domain-containing protein [Mariannaea sp. PMI_226]